MFIIIIGTRASGKSSIKDYLLKYKDFKQITFSSGVNSNINGTTSLVSNYSNDSDSSEVTSGIESSSPNSTSNSSDGDTNTLHGQEITSTHEHRGLVPDTPLSFLSMSSSAPSVESETSINNDESLVFTDHRALLNYVTSHWRDNFVTESLTTRAILEPFLKRPFVLLVSVDAPMLARFKRFQRVDKSISLEQFVADDDQVSFGPNSDGVTSSYLFASYHLCHVNVINSFSSVLQLHVYLDSLNLLDHDRLRPCWDSYFMKLASLASHRSNCMRRRVGAILVRDYTIIATGYNGTPRHLVNCNEGGCKRCNEGGPSPMEGFEECLCIHAEENALLEAGRERVGKDAVLYCNTCPCLKCTIKIVQNGVTEVVYNLSYKMDASSARVFKTAGVKLRQYSPPK